VVPRAGVEPARALCSTVFEFSRIRYGSYRSVVMSSRTKRGHPHLRFDPCSGHPQLALVAPIAPSRGSNHAKRLVPEAGSISG
jgi:hypothetical protein